MYTYNSVISSGDLGADFKSRKSVEFLLEINEKMAEELCKQVGVYILHAKIKDNHITFVWGDEKQDKYVQRVVAYMESAGVDHPIALVGNSVPLK